MIPVKTDILTFQCDLLQLLLSNGASEHISNWAISPSLDSETGNKPVSESNETVWVTASNGLVVFSFCVSFQVELRGNYSAERINCLNVYIKSTSTLRALLICVLSPLLCLVIVALVDCAPLVAPEKGSRENVMFWGRDFISLMLVMRAVVEQVRVAVPGLNMTATHATLIAISATIGSVSLKIGVSSAVGFPLPFALLVGLPGGVLVTILSYEVLFGRALKHNAALRKELDNFSNVLNCPLLLMLVYPVYIYGFIHLGPVGQNLYLALLPVIRIIGKNWISYFLDNKYDVMSQIVIFNTDVFNAMYISSCIQNSRSISITVLLIALDVVLAWVSMTDLRVLMRSVFLLQSKVPTDHPWKDETFIDIAAQIIKEDSRTHVLLSQRRYGFGISVLKLPDRLVQSNSSDTSIDPAAEMVSASNVRQVFPVSNMHISQTTYEKWAQSSNRLQISQRRALDGVFSEKESQRYVQRTAQLLFTTEFVLLVLYTKFIVPFLFGTCTIILFYLPNRAYYSQLDGYDNEVLKVKTMNVAGLGVAQFVLLLISGFKLQRELGISVLRFLSFGLDHGKLMVQTNLFLSIFYPIQNSLQHNGTRTATGIFRSLSC
ncbi:unnamed protein product [Phytophthora fragariaefolia]|uniref:Unnamed protein product n=1 Tax=Phytophthora fragariaefolia TaxID=1490495 RepID=A0A9W7D697_9STRA|nr:unnamed protein product [Phytophthora fragariaefolia]